MALLRSTFRALLDLALPPRCANCGDLAGEDHSFCGGCWQSLRFLGPPWCAACNVPFEHDLGDSRCGTCMAKAPAHDGVRGAVAYGPAARSLALRLKYGGRIALADTAARAMVRLMPEEADVIVPVPLHRWRLWRRGYNQSALIARALSRQTGVPLSLEALRRRRSTPSMRGLRRAQRAKAVAGAFEARAGLSGKSVVLVDDVHSSGATVNACAAVLKRGGAARVTVLCWARVLRDEALDD